MARPERIGSQSAVTYRGLRDWIEQVDKMGELLKVTGAHWDREMGAITQMLTESARGKAPALVFDEVPGYPKGYRTLFGQFSTIKRVALTLGLPLEYERKADIVKAYHHVMTDMKLIKPKMVKTGPIFENVLEGDKVDVLKLPVPVHHQADTHRYIGTADMCITKDPDAEWYNFGAYRCQVYDEKNHRLPNYRRQARADSSRQVFRARPELQVCHRLRPGPAALHAFREPAPKRHF
jgi:4-hydroxy-3-polyprenylbenzoate decarboxylase